MNLKSKLMNSIVEIRNLSKAYNQGEIQVTALDDIHLSIDSSDFLTLMGPSGSGKSTLLHIIAGIDRQTSGICKVQNIDLSNLNESALADWRNQNVGFIFQSFNLIPVLTAFENVELPLLLTRLGRKERKALVAAALELVGLEDRSHHLPKQLSGGQEQRVAIARALVTDPVWSSPMNPPAIWIPNRLNKYWKSCNRSVTMPVKQSSW